MRCSWSYAFLALVALALVPMAIFLSLTPERVAVRPALAVGAAIAGALASRLESVDRSKVLGLGISAPGPLDCENGRILNPPRFERWHGADIGKRLSDALGLPAYLEHDVCAMALHQRLLAIPRK